MADIICKLLSEETEELEKVIIPLVRLITDEETNKQYYKKLHNNLEGHERDVQGINYYAECEIVDLEEADAESITLKWEEFMAKVNEFYNSFSLNPGTYEPFEDDAYGQPSPPDDGREILDKCYAAYKYVGGPMVKNFKDFPAKQKRIIQAYKNTVSWDGWDPLDEEDGAEKD